MTVNKLFNFKKVQILLKFSETKYSKYFYQFNIITAKYSIKYPNELES